MERAGAATSRLTVDDWVQAGFAILAEEGITALKIDRLCSRLAVTKGSFYWHFTDIAGYRATLIDAWGELRDGDRRHFADMAGVPPRERLSQMMSSLLSATHWTLERAMREWARTDEAVAASVRAADQRVLDAVRQAFVGSRVRQRGCRSARQRHVRRGHRVPAPIRADTERPRAGPPGTLSRPHADALIGLPYLKVWYVRRMTDGDGHIAGDQPRVRRRLAERAQEAERAAQAAHRHRRRLHRLRAARTARARPLRRPAGRRCRRFSTRSAGWPTDARPAPGRSASTPCTTG